MKTDIDKVSVLIEALPYIQKFSHKTIVIKYGGSAMNDACLKKSFILDIILLKYVGIHPVLVHGGGPQIGETMRRMGLEPRFRNGMRITTEETLDVVEMVLVGKVNKNIVGLINTNGGKAVGLSGKDGNLIRAKRLKIKEGNEKGQPPEIIDIGKVGEVEEINPEVIEVLERSDFIPVIAPLGLDSNGETYNINADVVAGRVAMSLKAEKLILLTDVEGVLREDGSLVSGLRIEEARHMIESGEIANGMIPKVSCCIEALGAGVGKTHIIDGRLEHALLLELFTDHGIGTEIIP